MSDISKYTFRFEKTRWASEDQSFGIYKCTIFSNLLINIISGSLAFTNLDTGDLYECDAREKNHPKYGPQLELVSGPYYTFTEVHHYQNSLLSEAVNKGVTFTAYRNELTPLHNAVRATNYTWSNYPHLNPISIEDPNSILYSELGTFNEDRKRILLAIYSMVQKNQTIELLGSIQVPTKTVRRLLACYGGDLLPLLRKNPWELSFLEEVGMASADALAKTFNISFHENQNRAKAIAVSALKESMQNGDHFIYYESVITLLKNHGYKDVVTSFFVDLAKDMFKDPNLRLEQDLKSKRWMLYLKEIYDAEVSLANFIKKYCSISFREAHFSKIKSRLIGYSEVNNPEDFNSQELCEKCLEVWQDKNSIELNEHQIAGVISALMNPLMVICGLPGTGKTTMLRAVSSILNDSRVTLALMAPTGMASMRLEGATGLPAKTIHRTLGASGESSFSDESESYFGKTKTASFSLDVGGGAWAHTQDNPHPAECMIVDESSMLNTMLCNNIIEALEKHSKIIFVGDAAQLPPVGPGDLLNNLISLDIVPHTALSKIYRQDEASDIIKIAHAIQADEIDSCPFLNTSNIVSNYDFSQQFKFLVSNDESEILASLLIYAKHLWGAVQSNQIDSFQIISPRHLGKLGVTNLNKELRNLINPPHSSLKEVKLGSDILREGDRVMVVKNDAEQDVYNGDMGKVLFLDLNAKIATIKIFRKESLYITIPFNKITHRLRLAYAVTVHKVQGQEFDVVVFPIVQSFGKYIQRNLIYTALTRAKVSALFMGDLVSFFTACGNDREVKRKSFLVDRALTE